MSASEPIDDPSLEVKMLPKPRELGILGSSRDETCLRARWQPVYRRHELDTGADTEHGNLFIDVKGKDKWRKP